MADLGKHPELFDAYYYKHGCGDLPYERNQGWLDLFARIAERIIQDIQPITVLDAGCALGFLVEGLRNQGVDAFGIDISDYAIENVHESIKPYCWQGSVIDPFPQKYDLIVSIEVLEHLPKEQAEAAVANLCAFTDDILFSSSPFDYKEPTHFNVQPPEYWVNVFGRHGFYRDVDFDASFITPWTVRYRKLRDPIQRVIVDYERKLWLLLQEANALREINNEQRVELEAKEIEIAHRIRDIQDVRIELSDLRNSNSWQMILKFQRFRERIVPKKSNRERWMYRLLRVWRAWRRDGSIAVFRRIIYEVKYRSHTAFLRLRYRRRLATRALEVNSLSRKLSVTPHTKSVNIVICVHNALDDVRKCLESVLQYTPQPYTLIVVDDGSNLETEIYLQKFANSQGIILLRNETASGYTLAANKGLRASKGDYVVLLNSDTIVSPGWLDRMIACGESDEKIGVVGPLSNTASWQSVPETLTGDGDWVDNPLPDDLTIFTFSEYVSRYSGCLYPRLPFLNGFCLVIKRKLIEQIGYFDEQTFGAGYGEENDFCIRARKAGWELVVSDDVYIHHAQSKSYSHERRGQLAKNADVALAAKHGQQIISDGVKICRFSPVMLGIRARVRATLIRERLIVDGLRHWEGKRVLFLLPLTAAGGGGHVIIQEAKAMRKMGVDVRFMNLRGAQAIFEASFPENDIPIIYLEEPRLNKNILTTFDAIVASVFHSVEWLDPILPGTDRPIKAYYIQDFEPRFFTPGTKDYDKARDSYSLYPDLVRFAKTEWNCEQVRQLSGMDCKAIGPSLDIDLFRPRPKADLEWPNRPLRVSAMIRPSTPRRQAKFTMEVLRNFKENNKNSVEVILFGCESNDPEFQLLSKDFSWKHAGILTRSQLSSLLNEVDIFVDFSSFQAMGLTAMEAMACGAAVILPQEGGANSFAVHEVNAMIVDTHSKHRCLNALERLHKDHDLRIRLQRQAIADICKYPPEWAAYNILMTIFGE